MNQLIWGTPEALRELLCELVSWRSMTLTEGELNFPFKGRSKTTRIGLFSGKSYPFGSSRCRFGQAVFNCFI